MGFYNLGHHPAHHPIATKFVSLAVWYFHFFALFVYSVFRPVVWPAHQPFTFGRSKTADRFSVRKIWNVTATFWRSECWREVVEFSDGLFFKSAIDVVDDESIIRLHV